MLSPGTLYTTAALMALVAFACTMLCIVWTVPVLRRGIALATTKSNGWFERVGSGLVSVGIGSCALVAWYGVYCVLAALWITNA
ncbi:MAG: hypothetical protein JWP89_5633 [Schlesneria sp.]|nr:hypothetical protein [Schlesneria sp.]